METRGVFFAAGIVFGLSGFQSAVAAPDAQFEQGYAAVHRMAGCYLVDYSYTETEALKPGYLRDTRVYDVNQRQTVKEWIYAEDVSPKRIRLQHVLFATDPQGRIVEGSLLKHQAEDWEYDAPFLYDFAKPQTWEVRDLTQTPSLWTRRITALDDGLRYQCAAAWSLSTHYPEWNCENYAPIPGREFRDMGRKDYNTLERGTRILVYESSWLERQANTKVIDDLSGGRVPLARELGKNWYVRLPDSDCDSARAFTQLRRPFWELLRETWDQVLVGDGPFLEKTIAGQPSRYARVMQLEAKYLASDLADAAVLRQAAEELLGVIGASRSEE
jgi:hypothetical protein